MLKFKRKIIDKLQLWKETSNGRTAMLIEGARRVGKSFVAEQFGKEYYNSYLIIDFSNISRQILQVFEDDITNLDLFFTKLSIFYKVKLEPRRSLIIFDEIQLYPKARQAIKHLVADGRYDYLETGSLLTLKQNIQDIVLPSEEETLRLNPLDFEEFLWALGDDMTYPYIQHCYANRQPLGAALHRSTMNLFRQYMLVGGMPQAIAEYIDSKDFSKVDKIKRLILKLYRNDISKFASGYESKVLDIFDSIPSQLSKHEKRFSMSSLRKDARFRTYEDSFIWLDEARIINVAFNNTDPNVGLALNTDRLTLKCYMSDTGLLFSLAFSDKELLEDDVYKAILFDKLNLNEGMFLENIVAQMLVSKGFRLFFYSRSDKEDSKNRMEVDFLLSEKKKICPVEVKSSNYQRHASLDKFTAKFSKISGTQYIIYTKDFKAEGNILYLPVYMTECLS